VNARPPAAAPRSLGDRAPWLYLLVLLLWMLWRASTLALTCDEATTLRWHVPATWGRIFAHARPIGSNNHLLNTLSIKLLLGFLPATELVVRLPALCGFALYSLAALRWLRRWASGGRVLVGLVLLTANPFVLEMGVLARGYGLALGLWAWAAVWLLEWGASEARLDRRLPLAAFAASLALCANLSLAFPVAALGVLSLGCALRRAGSAPGRPVLLVGLVAWGLAAALVAGIYRPEVMERIQRSLQGWGGRRGVWRDSVASLVEASLWRGADPRWSQVGAVALLALLVLGTARAWLDWRARRLAPPFLACAFLWLVLAALRAHHWIAGARFPLDRGVLVLIPAFTVVFLALWERGGDGTRRGGRLASVIAVALLGLDLGGYRFRMTHLWWFDASAREAMQVIAAETSGLPAGSVRLAVWRPVWSAIEHYRTALGVAALHPTRPDAPTEDADLYYYIGAEAQGLDDLELVQLREFSLGGTILARPGRRAR
jgi:hypothetical protein